MIIHAPQMTAAALANRLRSTLFAQSTQSILVSHTGTRALIAYRSESARSRVCEVAGAEGLVYGSVARISGGLRIVEAGIRDGVDGSGTSGIRRSSGRKYLKQNTSAPVQASVLPYDQLMTTQTHRHTAFPPRQSAHQPATTHQLVTGLSDLHLTTSNAERVQRIGRARRINSRTSGIGKDPRISSVPAPLAVEVAVAVAGTV
jgi:hypothetical protein